MIGLNATPPPGLMPPGLPGLPGSFAPLNQMAQSQNQGSGYQPAYAPPVQMQAPDAGSALAALQAQVGPAGGAKGPAPGITPNSSTPPAAPAGGAAPAAAPAPGAPMSFSDMLAKYAQLAAGSNPMGQIGAGLASIGPRLGAAFGGGQPQAPNLGQLPGPGPQVNMRTPNIVPPLGVLGAPPPQVPLGGILGS